jgi:thiosulfate reductase cytochrome b subunit
MVRQSHHGVLYRHSGVTRLTHASFSLAFLALAVTGTQIFLHRHWIPHVAQVHQYAGLLMIASGLLYAGSGVVRGHFGELLFGPQDAAGLVPMIAYYTKLRSTPPPYDLYNPLQKLAYTAVLLMVGPALAATGVAMWTSVGGRALGVWHLGFALELVAFFFGHLLMVATTGLRNNVRAMITGWYEISTNADARARMNPTACAPYSPSTPFRTAAVRSRPTDG